MVWEIVPEGPVVLDEASDVSDDITRGSRPTRVAHSTASAPPHESFQFHEVLPLAIPRRNIQSAS